MEGDGAISGCRVFLQESTAALNRRASNSGLSPRFRGISIWPATSPFSTERTRRFKSTAPQSGREFSDACWRVTPRARRCLPVGSNRDIRPTFRHN